MNVSAHACKSTLIKYNVHGTLKTHVGPGRHSKLHCIIAIVCDMASQLGDTVYTCVHVSLYECQCTCTWHFKNSHWGQADIPTYTASISATLHHSTNRCMQAATCTCIITRGPIKNKVDHQFMFLNFVKKRSQSFHYPSKLSLLPSLRMQPSFPQSRV